MQEAERLQIPDSALDRAASLFREKFTRQKRTLSLARLVFDSFHAPRTAFARSAEPTAWQRLYQTETYNIELWQEGNAQEGWYIIGQVLPEQGRRDARRFGSAVYRFGWRGSPRRLAERGISRRPPACRHLSNLPAIP